MCVYLCFFTGKNLCENHASLIQITDTHRAIIIKSQCIDHRARPGSRFTAIIPGNDPKKVLVQIIEEIRLLRVELGKA